MWGTTGAWRLCLRVQLWHKGLVQHIQMKDAVQLEHAEILLFLPGQQCPVQDKILEETDSAVSPRLRVNRNARAA